MNTLLFFVLSELSYSYPTSTAYEYLKENFKLQLSQSAEKQYIKYTQVFRDFVINFRLCKASNLSTKHNLV